CPCRASYISPCEPARGELTESLRATSLTMRTLERLWGLARRCARQRGRSSHSTMARFQTGRHERAGAKRRRGGLGRGGCCRVDALGEPPSSRPGPPYQLAVAVLPAAGDHRKPQPLQALARLGVRHGVEVDPEPIVTRACLDSPIRAAGWLGGRALQAAERSFGTFDLADLAADVGERGRREAPASRSSHGTVATLCAVCSDSPVCFTISATFSSSESFRRRKSGSPDESVGHRSSVRAR